jgi:hypothetical protein
MKNKNYPTVATAPKSYRTIIDTGTTGDPVLEHAKHKIISYVFPSL